MERQIRTNIIQSIQGEYHYRNCTENVGREDELFYRLGELVEEGILTADEAQECFDDFIKSLYPDTTIVHIPSNERGRRE